jgi:hypothetical protein
MTSSEDHQAYAQGYQVGYQHGLQAAQQHASQTSSDYPANVVAAYPPSSSRLLMLLFLFKPILLIPHLIILSFLGMASGLVMFIAWWAVVITGVYPRSLWDFMLGVYRWQWRLTAYWLGLTDQYPPFSLS